MINSPETKSYLLIGLLGLASLLPGCAKKTASQSNANVVYTALPIRHDVSIYSEWIGTTVAFVDAEIHSQVTGYLSSQNYKEGSLIRKGDLLFQVDPRPFQVLFDQAKARLDANLAHLDEAMADTKQAEAEIDRAKTVFGKSDLDVKRYLLPFQLRWSRAKQVHRAS
jgi:multidrug resistance efflux pump